MVSPDTPFTCDGKLVEWKYQMKASNPFRAIVYRPVDGSDVEFQVVGVNNIPAGDINTPLTYTVPENERIAVKAGDLIGWSFDGAVLPFDIAGSNRIFWKKGTSNLHVNQIETLQYHSGSAHNPIRQYSIKATLEAFESQGTFMFISGIARIVLSKLLNKSFRTVALRTQISIFTSYWGK